MICFVLFTQTLDTCNRSRRPIFDTEDTETRFRKQNMRYRQNRDYSKRTMYKMYNFDEWTRNHYGESYIRREESMFKSSSNNENYRIYGKYTSNNKNYASRDFIRIIDLLMLCGFVLGVGLIGSMAIQKINSWKKRFK